MKLMQRIRKVKKIGKLSTDFCFEKSSVHPEMVIPPVGNITEFRHQETVIHEIAAKVS